MLLVDKLKTEHRNLWNKVGFHRFVNELGDDRILYGSDLPLIDARFGVGRIVTAKISEHSKRKILGLNALKVLNLNEAEVSI